MNTLIILSIIAIMIPVALIAENRYTKSHREDVDLKLRSGVLWTLGILLLLGMGWIARFVYEVDYEETEIKTADRGPYTLKAYQVGAPAFPFGPGKCRLKLYGNGEKIGQVDLEQANDGKNTKAEDFDIDWGSEGVAVIVHGEEQEDAVYVLYYDPLHPHRSRIQVMHANFIEWNEDGCRVSVCDPMENTVFPYGAKLTVDLKEGSEVIDLDGRTEIFHPKRSLLERPIGKKFRWSEGMVLEITFRTYADYDENAGYQNRALAETIENVDVIAIDVDE